MLMTRTRPGAEVRLDRSAPAAPPPLALDVDQRAVVEHATGHLLVLAGPGTGKTATLAGLVVGRIRRTVQPIPADAILALTFGRRAAGELAERISRRLGGGPMPVVSTFHSFAYGALRAHADPAAFLDPPRLLTAAEQEARLRELLTGAIQDGRLAWPASLAGAVGTRGIAEQVRALLARARGQGLDGRSLSTYGRRAGIPAWEALGAFFEEYLDTLGFEGTIDYAELIHRAAVLAHDPRAGRGLRERFRLVVVDEYQDTDPAQVALLRGLASGGAQIVAVGDPDQSIYGFRGADVRGILAFPDAFADPSGRPARIVVLRHTRRFPEAIARAARGVLGPISLAPLPADVQRRHRCPQARPGEADVRVRTFPSPAAEAAAIAEALLHAHAGVGAAGEGGDQRWRPLAWREMAVLVRNPALHGHRLVRALRGAGIPVAVPPAETPIAQEPGVRTLLGLLELGMGVEDLRRDAGRMLLGGPVGRVDAVSLRELGRRLLGAADGDHSDDLLTQLVSGRVAVPEDCPRVVEEGIARVRSAVAATRGALGESGTVSDVLWAAWSATDWPARLREAALAAEGHAASAANRDLDALLVLFDLAHRLPVHRRGRAGLAAFVDDVRAMRLPIEGRMGPAPDRDEVRLLSAHRAKGLEFELVVVAAVQEGQWPDVRLRSDLLRVAELGPRGRMGPQSRADVMAEERRLMYVSCTRARSRLLVTAVAEPVDGGAEPSRFLRELGVPVEHVDVRAPSLLTATGLVVALRQAACAPARLTPEGTLDPAVESLRDAALQRLAVLASRAGGGEARAALSAADPERWWWSRDVTGDGAEPGPAAADAHGPGQGAPGPGQGAHGPALSASAVTALLRCPLRWFLDRRVDAGPQSGTAAAVGLVVHAVAEALVRGAVQPEPAAVGELIDGIWEAMPFSAHYERQRERTRVAEMVDSLLAWHAGNPRTVLAAELDFHVTVPIDGMEVVLRGSIDRVEADSEGRVHLVDLKTGKAAASGAEAAEHPQLGVYQLAVLNGALGELDPQGTRAHALAGAELVHVGARLASGMPKVRHQAGLSGERTWAHEIVAEAARLSAGPRFPARPNSRCGTCPYRSLCPAGTPPAGHAEGGADHA